MGAALARVVLPLLGAFLLSSCGAGEAVAPDAPQDSGDRAPNGAAPAVSADPGDVGRRIRVSGGSFARLSPEELREVTRRRDPVLVNTHVPFEGNIPGTDLSVPYDEIGESLDRLPGGKDAEVVLYCKGGPMSFAAAETLVGAGYSNVYDLEGGMDAWEEAGFPLKGA